MVVELQRWEIVFLKALGELYHICQNQFDSSFHSLGPSNKLQMQSLLWTLTAPKTISLTQAGVTSFFILGRTVKTKTSTERPWCQRCTPFLGGARGRQIVRFWTSLRAVSLWQKRWGIWDRHGWKALKELYCICDLLGKKISNLNLPIRTGEMQGPRPEPGSSQRYDLSGENLRFQV